MARAHKRENDRRGVKIVLPDNVKLEDINFWINKFQKKADQAGVFDDLKRTSRYTKPSQKRKQKAYNKIKNRKAALREQRDFLRKIERLSITK